MAGTLGERISLSMNNAVERFALCISSVIRFIACWSSIVSLCYDSIVVDDHRPDLVNGIDATLADQLSYPEVVLVGSPLLRVVVLFEPTH